MSHPLSEPTKDVLVASQRDDFWQDIQNLLKGFPYRLHRMADIDSIMNCGAEISPALTLVDGHGGTLPTSEWVQGVRMSCNECPVIVLYEASDLLDFHLIKKNGADHILHANYEREVISDMVLNLAPVVLRGTQIPISALLPLNMADVDPEENINFDVYIYLPSNHKSFRVRKEGGKIDTRLLEKSTSTNQRLYIKKTQIKAFFEYARTVLTKRNLSNPVSQTEKIFNSKQHLHEIISEFLNSGAADFQAGKAILERCRQILGELELLKEKPHEERLKDIFKYAGLSRSTYQDTLSMAVFAAHFAAFLGMDAAKIESAALAGLLHNVGLAQLPPSTSGKSLESFTSEELAEYRRYPDRSVLLIKSKKVPLPQEVSTGILQHQENNDGSGFPQGLGGEKIEPMGKVLRLAMRFLELTVLEEDQLIVNPREALVKIRDEAISSKSSVDLVTVTQVLKKFGT